MSYSTIIAPEDLARYLEKPHWIIVDCRFSLTDVEAGRRAYRDSHIPGAVYAHLDDDLSGPPRTDHGRHPLPAPAAMVDLFSRLGIDSRSQVVAYDDSNGAIAARLWWMLRYMDHEAVAVLDGGWPAWKSAGLPTVAGVERNEPSRFVGVPQSGRLVVLDQVAEAARLIDARAPARFRAEEEPYDPVAGHIPGAVNYHYLRNLDEEGRMLPRQRLRDQLEEIHGETAPADVVYYCGSGVSACQNLLAQAHAGLEEGRLYVGSWSEWSADPTRPVATEAG